MNAMDKKINVCWLLGTYEDARLIVAVAKQLPAHLHHHFLTYSAKALTHIRENGFEASFFEPAEKTCAPEAYLALEKKYGLPTLRLIYNSVIALRALPESKVLPKVAGHLHFFEQFFTKQRCDYFFFGTSGMLAERTAYAVARAKGIPHFVMESGPLDRAGSLVLSDIDENWIWSEALDLYKELQQRELTPEESTKVKDILHSFLTKGKMYKMCRDPAFKLIKTYVKGLVRYVKEGSGDSHVSLAQRAKNEVTRWYRINKFKLHRGFFTTFDPGQKYIFFPIHFIEDSQVTVREPFYYNQFELVRQIALSLPVGTLLYTKTHPDDLGGVAKEQLDLLRKIPNVRLLDPLTNSHDIIKHAQATIAINSTAGWETMLYNKPLIVLGNVFYAYQKDVVRVDDIRTLPAKIREALDKKQFYDENDRLKFIYACVSTPGGGTIFRHYYNAPLLPDDVSGFAQTVTEKIARYEKEKQAC
jgi:capsule polysaccharide modification protein KpsS